MDLNLKDQIETQVLILQSEHFDRQPNGSFTEGTLVIFPSDIIKMTNEEFHKKVQEMIAHRHARTYQAIVKVTPTKPKQ